MAIVAQLFIPDPAERRGAARRAIGATSTLRRHGGLPLDILVRDLSADGFRVDGVTLAPGDRVRIGLAGGGRAEARVTWRTDDACGCAFETPLTPDVLAAAFAGGVVREGGFGEATAAATPVPRWGVASRIALLASATLGAWAMLGAQLATHAA